MGAVTSDKYYYLKDHLGSIRVVVDTVGEIVSYSDYDPWGMILNGRSSNYGFADDKYKFTSKELDQETQYYHYTWRPYDGRVARWLQVDPLTDITPEISPFVYCNDNPISIMDLFGMDTIFVADLETVVVIPKSAAQQAQTISLPFPRVSPLPPMPTDINDFIEQGRAIRFLWGEIDKLNQQVQTGVMTGVLTGFNILFAEKKLTNNPGKIAAKFGATVKAVDEAIHKAKIHLGGGTGKGGRKNPDVEVDLNDGEMYPRYPDGYLGDSIGNVLDYLH